MTFVNRSSISTSAFGDPMLHNVGNTKKPPFGGVNFITPGDHTFQIPRDVYSLHGVAIGSGGAGGPYGNSPGGAGGELRWKNNIAVTPGQIVLVRVGVTGNLGDTYITINGVVVCLAHGGQGSVDSEFWGAGSGGDNPVGIGDGGGPGGHSGQGGGAGGYLGHGCNTRWGEWALEPGFGSSGPLNSVSTGTGLWGISRDLSKTPYARGPGHNAGFGLHFCGGGGPGGGGTKPGRNGGARLIWSMGASRGYPYDALPWDARGNIDLSGGAETYL